MEIGQFAQIRLPQYNGTGIDQLLGQRTGFRRVVLAKGIGPHGSRHSEVIDVVFQEYGHTVQWADKFTRSLVDAIKPVRIL